MAGRNAEGAAAYLPEKRGMAALRAAAAHCQGCDLHRAAKQTVFSEGRVASSVVMIGEEPGDREDTEGTPFVGPAGRLLDRALAELGVDRKALYLTNAVKHFSFHPDARGKRRIHQRPRAHEIAACRPWLVAELAVVRPRLVVCLGATAAGAVAGSGFHLTEHRGQLMPRPDSVASDLPGRWSMLATVHPSAVLRAPDRHAARLAFQDDLRPMLEFLS